MDEALEVYPLRSFSMVHSCFRGLILIIPQPRFRLRPLHREIIVPHAAASRYRIYREAITPNAVANKLRGGGRFPPQLSVAVWDKSFLLIGASIRSE